MALSIDIAANTRQAQSQVKDLSKELDKVGGSLDDVAKDGDKAADKLERSFRDIVKDADDAGRDIKKGISKGLKETADEAKQSGKEAAASFSGEFSDVGSFLQETVAQGLGGFGPLGLAAGLAGAAGIGIVTTEILNQQAQAEALGGYFAGAYQKAAEEGRLYIDAATIIGEAQDIIFNPDRQNEYNDALADANTIGIDANTVIRARAGDQDALNTVLAATAAKQQEVKDKAEEGGSTAIRLSLDQQLKLQGITREYEHIGELHDSNAEAAKRANDIKAQLSQDERNQIQRTRDADQARYEAMAALYATPITATVQLQDNTDYGAFRSRVLSRLGTFRPEVNLGPGVGRQLLGP